MIDLDDDAEHDKSETPEEELIEQARERYKVASESDALQRDREEQALRFQVPELQWSDADARSRKGDGNLIPPRPMLSISLLDQPRQLILNQMRQADLGIEIHPVSEDANQDTAEAIQGLYRHIERKSNAEIARGWAFERAVNCGRGVYRVLTEYDDEGGDPSDQKIVIRRILHQEGVYLDPAAQEPDWSDGNFAFVCTWFSRDEFKRKYPKAKLTAASSNSVWLEGMREQAPEWVEADDVLVAEYWYKQHDTEKFTVDGEERERDTVTVMRAVLNGWELLEKPVKWPGKYIPLIPVTGRELVPFDEQRRFMGLIEPAMDAQRMYNASASSFVERMVQEPKAPWIGNAEVFEGYEEFYRQSAVRNLPYLPYKTVVVGGQPLPPPQRAQIDLTGASLAAQGMQVAQGWVQSSTALFDPSLGNLPQKDRSGRAIMALQDQANQGTGHFLMSFSSISLPYEAKVILDLIPKIYDRPGRVTRILTGDQLRAEPIMLNRPFVINPQTKRPQAWMPPPVQPMQNMQQLPASMPPPGMLQRPPMPAPRPPMPAQRPDNVKEYNLTAGVYGVAVNVGKSFQTRLQEGSQRIGEFLAQEPALFTALGDIFLNFQDWPGAREMSKRMVKLRDAQMPFLRDDAEQGPSSDQLKSQLQGMQQQMQMQGQALQQAIQMVQSKQLEQQAKIEVAQLQAQTALEKERAAMAQAELEARTTLQKTAADNETKLLIANLGQQFQAMLEAMKLENANKAAIESQARDQQHDMAMSLVNEPGPERPEEPEPTEFKGETE